MGYFTNQTDLDRRVADVADLFHNAALGAAAWEDALSGLADVSGGYCGQLVGLGAAAAVPFNWMSRLPPEAAAEFAAASGGDPRINSRVREGSRAAELQVLGEEAFTTEEDALRHRDYGDWLVRHDIGDVCLTPLLRRDDMLVGLACAKSRSQGAVSHQERRVFAALAPHVRSAVRTQMAIEGEGMALLSNALAAMSVHAFVCDGEGRVRAMSAPAEALVIGGGHLKLQGGRLQAVRVPEAIALQAALAAAAHENVMSAPTRPVVLHDRHGGAPLLLEISRIAGRHACRFGAAVLVLARPPARDLRSVGDRAQALLGLTKAEGAVAGQLAAGAGPGVIAERTGVSIGTVRTHIRGIFAKAGVRSQVELVAILADLR